VQPVAVDAGICAGVEVGSDGFTVSLNVVALFSSLIVEIPAEFACAFCGESNDTWIDLSAGSQQSYIEDCQVCCRPNQLFVSVCEETLTATIESEYVG
jgi:hypothetical protein